jgi:hypothetical protein
MTWIKKQIRQAYKYNTADWSGVEPTHRYVANVFFLDSEAGLLKFKPKTQKEASRFRDDIVNRFSQIAGFDNQERTRLFFELYKDARKKYKVSWKANFRTRCRSFIYNAV